MEEKTNGAGVPVLSKSSRIAIINRGEAAVRFIKAVKEFNLSEGCNLSTVVFYLEEEKHSLFVKVADNAISFTGEVTQATTIPYINRDLMFQAVKDSGCDAVWMGWGFLSEDVLFTQMIESAGIVFIGPSSQSMALLGDKIAAKKIAFSADVPILPWSEGGIRSLKEAEEWANKIGYPVILKAANAGGGRGIRRVFRTGEGHGCMTTQFHSVKEETLRITNNDVVFMEALVELARHLEVQVVADHYGNIHTYGVRDCSVQRNNQKVIEETMPALLPEKVIVSMEEAAARLIKKAGYYSVGTVEYIYDLKRRQPYFMEVNTRLQVEHPITEQLFGVDLVKMQLKVAMGEAISSKRSATPRGAVIEVRLNAEDPDKNFAPAPGRVSLFVPPTGPGIRVDSGVEEGSSIPSLFDSMIAKIISFAPTREEAIARLIRAVDELRVKIEGGTTNRALLKALLTHPLYQQGGVSTSFLPEMLERPQDLYQRGQWGVALISLAIHNYEENYRGECENFLLKFDRPSAPQNLRSQNDVGVELSLSYEGIKYNFKVRKCSENYYHLQIAAETQLSVVAFLERGTGINAGGECKLTINGQTYRVLMVPRGDSFQCEVDGIPYHLKMDNQGMVKAPSPSMVLQMAREVGESVQKGELLLVLEAMKMEMPIIAEAEGIIEAIYVKKGEQVCAGAPLMQISAKSSEQDETTSDVSASPAGAVEVFVKPPAGEIEEEELLAREFKAIFLGYDSPRSGKELFDCLLKVANKSAEGQQRILELFKYGIKVFNTIEKLFSKEEFYEQGAARAHDYQDYLKHYFRRQMLSDRTLRESGLSDRFLHSLENAIGCYRQGIGHGAKDSKEVGELTSDILFRIYLSHAQLRSKAWLLLQGLFELQKVIPKLVEQIEQKNEFMDLLDGLSEIARDSDNALADAAAHTRYYLLDHQFQKENMQASREHTQQVLSALFAGKAIDLSIDPKSPEILGLLESDESVVIDLLKNYCHTSDFALKGLACRLLADYYFRDLLGAEASLIQENKDWLKQGRYFAVYKLPEPESTTAMAMGICLLMDSSGGIGGEAVDLSEEHFFVDFAGKVSNLQELLIISSSVVVFDTATPIANTITTAMVDLAGATISYRSFTRRKEQEWVESLSRKDISPLKYRELRIDLFENFELTMIEKSERLLLMQARAYQNNKDERLLAFVDVPQAQIDFGPNRAIQRIVGFEEHLLAAAEALRFQQAKRKKPTHWNRISITIRSPLSCHFERLGPYPAAITQAVKDLHLEKVTLNYRLRHSNGRIDIRETRFEHASNPPIVIKSGPPLNQQVTPLNTYEKKLIRSVQLGAYYPYALVTTLLNFERHPQNRFDEYDYEGSGESQSTRPVAVSGRPPGENRNNTVFGIITNHSRAFPDGVSRVLLLSDPSSNLGALAEEECRAVIAAIDLAEEKRLPLEWVPISSGARIDMDSGTENLDWTAAVLRRIIEFTQSGGEINIIVSGINVGAQSYWNAEATMLMHTRGILIMTEQGAMLLTGKKALEYSGSVSAEDSYAIGGVEKVMGPNGQAQFRVKDLNQAYQLLFVHYELTYANPGAANPSAANPGAGAVYYPKRRYTEDPWDRDVTLYPYVDPHINPQNSLEVSGDGNGTISGVIGDILLGESNPDRKRAFDIRQVMKSVIDQDAPHLERWQQMENAETAVVWECRIGGYASGMIAIESRPLKRLGHIPNDGPDIWTGGTLFPYSSKKVARALNSFSCRLPTVILANLSGFDGSPESLRQGQLEFGAEIGRAVVNFKGPIIFVVVARYHGGAYVVFSRALNPNLRVVALEKTFASVIGGGAAAAVVFPSLVNEKTYNDPRMIEARRQLKQDPNFTDRDYDEIYKEVHRHYQMVVAQNFDQIHSVERAQRVGSVQDIISPRDLRSYLIKAIEDGSVQE
ncbi:MAG: ATP-grasp domain-containing protein [Oligoflexia bacterium]|nr:ATP-grasp domain-containing protein [Oligoflexia bacterium]